MSKYDIKNLTLEEKMQLLCGKNMWQTTNANGKLPELFLSDGPHGLRMMDVETEKTKKATAMPNLHLLANSWDVELAYLDGETIADDCIEKGADVLLAPGVNIKRTPLCGRNFEYFSEDPLLAGVMAKAYIEGVQSKGIGTSLKHFCANNREYDRFFQTSEVDERTLREIYLPAFEIALEAKPWTVMSAYNPVNGVYAAENPWLMKDLLRGEWGYNGLIMSDWGAAHNSARMIKATVDLRMPYSSLHLKEMQDAYNSGYLTEEEIDASVENVLALMEKCKETPKTVTTTKQQRHENAVKIVKESIVLLKNEGDILPLRGGKISVVGDYAKKPCYGGGGSALAETDFECPELAKELASRLGDGADIKGAMVLIDEGLTQFGIKRAYKDAYQRDTVILCLGTSKEIESEGYDREHMRLPSLQEDLILNMAKYNENIVVVLNVGAPIDMSAWIDKVKAVVLLGFSGEGGQEALADILTGKACPCGKLAETYPIKLEDTPTGIPVKNAMVDRYKEGLFVGYRWYDSMEKEVAFPFGHGLSYAEFEYSDIRIDKITETEYDVSFEIKNISQVDAKEIAQVYVRDVLAMVERPYKELKGFVKVALKAGESKRVTVKLNARSFAYYNTVMKKWHIEDGDFEVLVGSSSRDIRLRGNIAIELPFETQNSLNYE